MKHIKLLPDENLTIVADLLQLTPEDLTERILTEMVRLEVTEDDPVDCGLTIAECFYNFGISINEIPNILFPKQEVDKYRLINLKIWGTAVYNPCPDCGCELEEDEDGYDCYNCEYSKAKYTGEDPMNLAKYK